MRARPLVARVRLQQLVVVSGCGCGGVSCGPVGLQVTGIVRDSRDTERYLVTGSWDERLEAVKVLDISKSQHQHNVVYNTSAPIVLWQRTYPPYVTGYFPPCIRTLKLDATQSLTVAHPAIPLAAC